MFLKFGLAASADAAARVIELNIVVDCVVTKIVR
jgi:hypothetical protein